MAEISEERYHILCAAILKKHIVRDSRLRLVPGAVYKTIDFSPYKPFKIPNAEDVGLEIRNSDGFIPRTSGFPTAYSKTIGKHKKQEFFVE